MQSHDVAVQPSKSKLEREDQLAWKIADVASDAVEVPAKTAEMIAGGCGAVRDGREIADEMAVANAHPMSATPWKRADYVQSRRFLEACERLPSLTADELFALNVVMKDGTVKQGLPGLF